MNMIEQVARALATKHYCDRFDLPATHKQVFANVNANWNIFYNDAKIAIAAMRSYLKENGVDTSELDKALGDSD